MIKLYDKIVRTNNEKIIHQTGRTTLTKVISKYDELMIPKFKEKIKEESDELIEANNDSDILEEACDLIQVIEDYVSLYGYTMSDLEVVRNSKRIRKGSFLTLNKDALILMSVSDGEE